MAEVGEGARAAAILLTLLDDASAVDVLGRLDADQAELLAPAMRAIVGASEQDVDAALDRFVQTCQAASHFGDDAVLRSRRVFQSALGDGCAEAMFGTEDEGLERLTAALRWLSPEAIARTLSEEAPQAAALVLSVLEPGRAAKAVSLLSEAKRADLMLRAATLGEVDAAALADLCVTLESAQAAPRPALKLPDAATRVAKIVGRLPGDVSPGVMKALRKADKALADQVEEDMVVFDDLTKLSDRDLGTVLRGIDAEVLTLALRASDKEEVDRFLGCISARAADTIRDELAEKARVKRVDIDDARRTMLATVRTLAANGEIEMPGMGDADA